MVAAKAFQRNGWEVASVTGLTHEPPDNEDDGIKSYVPTNRGDALGLTDIEPAINDFKPDIIYMTTDLGTAVVIASATPDMPAFTYIPIEGEPIGNVHWRNFVRGADYMVCSKYGADLIERTLHRQVPYVYHGVNHDVFNTSYRTNGDRDYIRKEQQWDDKFVLVCVATNVRRKQLVRLIEAMHHLRYKFHREDIRLYFHTIPFDNYWLEGWNLPEIASTYGVYDLIQFHPLMNKHHASIPDVGTKELPGLSQLVASADLFVLPSQVEGFGLPIAEAMACGTPVLVTRYGAGWEVASPAGRGIPIKDWEIHKSGTLYGNVDSMAMAKEILRLKNSPKELARMSEMGVTRAEDFQWKAFEDVLIPSMEAAYSGYQSRRAGEQEEDTAEERENGTDGHVPKDTLAHRLRADGDIPDGQVSDILIQDRQEEESIVAQEET